jgi:hypothetical protein
MRYIIFVTIVLLFFANTVFANVVINEVAWMGTVDSYTNEWIELYNNGQSAVDLNGWIFSIEGKKDISLSGSIAVGSFYLIERTDDETVPGIPADLISSFGTGLSNSGAVLILKNNQGTEIQKLDASSGWPAGDNSTKQTMQWNGSVWITADPTPKAQNTSFNQSASTSGVDVSDEPESPESTTVVVWPTEPQIYANAGLDKTAVAGADVYFSGQALGLQKEPLENARYLWNFGDGAIAEGQNTKHVYKYPGEYIAVLDVSSGKYSVSDRSIAKIIPNQLEIIEVNQNYIKLHNGSNVELDISSWFLRTENSLFKFPANTFIKTNRDLMIDSSISGFKAENQKAEILYPNSSVAFSHSGPIVTKSTKSTTVVDSSSIVKYSVSNNSEEEIVATSTDQTANIITSTQNNSFGLKKWLAIILGMSVFFAGGFIFIRRQSSL